MIFETAIRTDSENFCANRAAYQALIDELRARVARVTQGGNPAHVARHLARGKLLVRDRIDRLCDPGTAFLELSTLAAWGQYDNDVPGAGIVTGIGVVQGRPVAIIANDATVKGGSFFHETVKKHSRAQEIAANLRLPCLYLVDCGGAYLPEQDRVFPDRDHFGNAFWRQCRMSASGLAQIALVFGGCTAGGAYIPALADQVIMVEGNARIHLGGPSIVKVAINEDVDGETLGGAAMHTTVSGVSDHRVATEPEGLDLLRRLVADLPDPRAGWTPPNQPVPPVLDPSEIPGIVSADPKSPYDAREIMARLVDASDLSEFKPEWGANAVCAFSKIHGCQVGIIGNNGALVSEASLKAAQFIQICDQRRIPLLFLHNITGFMVGTAAERGGIAKDSAKMVYAMANARVPKLSVIVGGSYGAGNYGMCGRGFRPDFLFAWPSAKLATMSADIAANVMLELRRSNLRQKPTQTELEAIEAQVRAQYGEQSDPYYATSRLWDDGLIEPAMSRDVLGLCLSLLASRPDDAHFAPVYRM
ncbi:3-methylcrotonyl-CoA carboxylase beta subunit [Roseovarius litoreus]|uniref:3-methylcrotonyl-CoA carboxylase beta subunit n=1 Tax=Roseovarius litoreus TaxID=1155722 RepID=A0A1M7EGX0_9RHOB|nr:3-methylcrotonyl-CoA carboxylase beta subunit [Roseovarius litoreus]